MFGSALIQLHFRVFETELYGINDPLNESATFLVDKEDKEALTCQCSCLEVELLLKAELLLKSHMRKRIWLNRNYETFSQKVFSYFSERIKNESLHQFSNYMLVSWIWMAVWKVSLFIAIIDILAENGPSTDNPQFPWTISWYSFHPQFL